MATGAQTQEEVTAMIEKLKGAEDKLVDASALRTAIADAEEKVETSTVSSAEPVKAKIAEAKTASCKRYKRCDRRNGCRIN